MPLSVGTHENLVLHKVVKNDKGTLVIGFKEAGEIDQLAALSAAGQTNFEAQDQDLLIFPPNVKDFNGATKTTDQILKNIAELKDPLDHIAEAYLTVDKRKWDVFKDLDIDKHNISTTLANQATLDKVYDNVVKQFIAMMTPVVGENSKKVRVMFIRSSKAKHFPKLRTKYLNSYPFIEPMSVPTSKLRFSKYEIENGLDNGDRAGGSVAPPVADIEAASALFTPQG